MSFVGHPIPKTWLLIGGWHCFIAIMAPIPLERLALRFLGGICENPEELTCIAYVTQRWSVGVRPPKLVYIKLVQQIFELCST